MTAAEERFVDEVVVEGPAGAAIRTLDLIVRRGRAVVVHDLSLCVPRGAIYGLTGPSGSGKSTTLRVLATVLRLDGGTAWIDGIDVSANPRAARARTGYLPDRFGVYGALTLREYLRFYAALYRIPHRRRGQVADELLELFRLTSKRDQPVGRLSRGLLQQLGMARCLVHDPDVLLLDEPAAGMDLQARLDLRDMLGELSGLGKTILISSNLPEALAETCTHIGLIRDGRLIIEGGTGQVLDDVMEQLAGGVSEA